MVVRKYLALMIILKKTNLIYISSFSKVAIKTIKKVKLMRLTYKRWNNKMNARRRKRRRKGTKRRTRKRSNSRRMKKISIKTQ